MAYRVKSNIYAIGGSGLFFPITLILRRGCKKLNKIFSCNFLCQFSVQTITIKMSCCQNTLLQTIHSIII